MKKYWDNIDFMKLFDWFERRYRLRAGKEKKEQILYGNRDKKPLLYRLDKIVEYSGLKRKLKFMNAELLIAVTVLFMSILFFVTEIITHRIIIGVVAALSGAVIVWCVLYFCSGKYYVRLENNLMTFLNLIDNFNKSEDDIVQIFKKTVPYVEEPLKTLLIDFTGEVQTTGNVNQAFDNLNSKIEHNKCRMLIRNLQVCARYETNYSLVVKDLRAGFMCFLAVKSERKAIISNGRAEIIILILCSVLTVSLFANIAGDIWSLLLDDFIGNIILAYCFIVLLICVVVMFLFDKNGG